MYHLRMPYIAPSAVVLGAVTLGARTSIWPCAVVRADTDRVIIGDDSNVQDGAVLHCDEGIPCTIGNRVTIGHRAIVHGATVEDDTLVGMGAIVLNRAVVGKGSLVGAGALVTEGTVVPPGSLVLGVPAKVVRPVTDNERERHARGWAGYVDLAAAHEAGKFPEQH